jgi:O-antigen ligase
LLASIAFRQQAPIRAANLAPIVLLVATIVLSIVWNRLPFWEYKSHLIAPVVAILIYLAIPGFRELRFLLLVFLAFVVLSTSVAALQYAGMDSMYLPSQRRITDAGGFKRGIGLANHFWMTGLYCAATMPIAVMGSLTADPRWKRRLYAMTGVFAVAGLTFTTLRAGFAGGLFGAALALYLWDKRTAVRYAIGAAVMLGVVFAAVPVLRESSQALYEHTTSLDSSAKRRPELVMQGLETWQRSPLLGVGPKGMRRFYEVGDAHNSYVNVLTDYGVIGAVCFVAVMVLSFSRLASALRRLPEERPLLLALTGALASAYVVGIVHSVNYIEMFWLFPALALATDRFGRGKAGAGARAKAGAAGPRNSVSHLGSRPRRAVDGVAPSVR